jgi:alpha-tubulin suppressor-like RCC1 family protein
MTQVSGGQLFACGLAAAPNAGAAVCWGNNFYGQLGIGTADAEQHATPIAVEGGHMFEQISAGFGHVCALDTDGAAWCWGAESEGNLGVGLDRTGNTRPLRVAGLLDFTSIDVGGNTSCGIVDPGDVWCWGNNEFGQLGNDSTEARSYVPVKVAGGRSFSQISVGTFHTCGISLGAVYCWGRNTQGQLGIGATTPDSASQPVAALGALGITVRVAAGNTHTCSVNSAGETYCWGGNENGQLGDGTTTPRTSGVLVQTDARFTSITTGLLHTCAIQADGAWNGATYCWGSNGSGRLGTGTLTQLTRPVRVVAP